MSIIINHLKPLIIIFYILNSLIFLFGQNNEKIDSWKIDMQILLGFSDQQVDGNMGKSTFEALKNFSMEHQLTDVVLRGEYEDLGYWGFQQYVMKYHQYWIRELKNNKIIDDVIDKEYLKQADETLYSFEIAIEQAQLEVERLVNAKSKSKRIAQEKKLVAEWNKEKIEADRIISALGKAILTAEEEASKWGVERIRALRLAEEREQLARLEERKLEAVLLTSDLEDVIRIAKNEINRLVDTNKELKTFIETSSDTKSVVNELKIELNQAKTQLDSLSIQKNSLEKQLQYIESKVGSQLLEELKNDNKSNSKKQKRKWYQIFWPFSKK